MSRFKYDATGSGTKPSLGKKSFHTPVRPTGGHAERVLPAAKDTGPKVARPGGRGQGVYSSGGESPKAARPGWREKMGS